MRIKTIKNTFRLLWVFFISTLISGCEKNSTPNDYLKFGHDSPRPECLYSVDPGRTAYYDKPVVVMAGWSEPGAAVNLGEPVNSIYLDGEHALSPDGTQLFLTSDRPGGFSETDIWVSAKTSGVWSTPVNPGVPINTENWEGQPGFAANDPNTMYFVSDRDGPSSIYRSAYNGTNWSEPEMVITGYVGEPSLTENGNIMYFVHVLVDDDGVFGSNICYVIHEK